MIEWQLIHLNLKEFKDSHAINDKGTLESHKACELIYDYITSDAEGIVIEINISDADKKALWKQAKNGFQIKLYDKQRTEMVKELSAEALDLHKKQRDAVIIQIYKTRLVEYHLNILADNGQFVEFELPKILI